MAGLVPAICRWRAGPSLACRVDACPGLPRAFGMAFIEEGPIADVAGSRRSSRSIRAVPSRGLPDSPCEAVAWRLRPMSGTIEEPTSQTSGDRRASFHAVEHKTRIQNSGIFRYVPAHQWGGVVNFPETGPTSAFRRDHRARFRPRLCENSARFGACRSFFSSSSKNSSDDARRRSKARPEKMLFYRFRWASRFHTASDISGRPPQWLLPDRKLTAVVDRMRLLRVAL